MNTFDGFFIPNFAASEATEWRYLESPRLRVRYPQLTTAQLTALWLRLHQNRSRVLINTPVAHIVDAIDAAARHLRASIEETARLVSAATGYSEPVATETLEHMFGDWRAPSLNALLHAELGDPAALDRAVANVRIPGKQSAAFGHPATFHVFSGNVPGVAVTSLIRSLLVKSATLCKTASGEPVLPVLFARALEQVAPDIATCLAVSYWPPDAPAQQAALELADAVVVYGGAEAVASVHRQVHPEKRLVIHGPRLSFGVIGEQSPADVAYDVATAVAAYDQQGCVSPHVVYVVGDAERARSFARAVAGHLERISEGLPRGRLSPEEAVAVRNARTAAEFAADAQLHGAEGGGYSVIYEDNPSFKLSCLNRVLYVKPVPAPMDVVGLLPTPQLLQSAALEGFPETTKAELARALGLCGVSRITSFARLPWPPMDWHHDGSAPLGELLRWQDIEG